MAFKRSWVRLTPSPHPLDPGNPATKRISGFLYASKKCSPRNRERCLYKKSNGNGIIDNSYQQQTKDIAYWRVVLKNPSAYPTYFKLHLYNVASSISVYQYWNNDWFNNGKDGSLGLTGSDGWVLPGELDIDAYENSMCICAFNLNLDDDIWLDLHYNSEDGTVLCANQLIEQLRSGDTQIPCVYKDAVANVYLPGARSVTSIMLLKPFSILISFSRLKESSFSLVMINL